MSHTNWTHIIISFEFRPARIERLHCYFVVLDAGACECHIMLVHVPGALPLVLALTLDLNLIPVIYAKLSGPSPARR